MKLIKRGKLILPSEVKEVKKLSLLRRLIIILVTFIFGLGIGTNPKPIPSPSPSSYRSGTPKVISKQKQSRSLIRTPTRTTDGTKPSSPPQIFTDPSSSSEKKILVIQHDHLIRKLTRTNITNEELVYGSHSFIFRGRYSFVFVSVPFSINAKFKKIGTNLGLEILSLSIKGNDEKGIRLDDLKSRVKKLFEVNDKPNTEYEINIEKKGLVVYRQPL